ncbi:MAG: hypothetical protein E6902_10235 [Paeniclostridium sordellii]|nr:hypothetical protein [Paeniclostridium sordellii]
MKNLKRNITLFLTLFIFTITCAFSFSIDKAYANTYEKGKNTLEYQVAKGSSHSSSPRISSGKSSYRPSSGTFKSKSSTTKPSSSSFKSKPKSDAIKPKSSSLKPDSGKFSTKQTPKSESSDSDVQKPKSSSIKPDSGKFSTKPSTKPNTNSNDKSESSNNKKYYDDDYRGSRRTYIPHSYGGGFFGFGGYNPFRYMGYRLGIRPIIMDVVLIITVLIVLYIIIDFIRSRKNR